MKTEMLEEAADWYDNQAELSTSEHAEFLRWLENKEHRLAYEKIVSYMGSPEITLALDAQQVPAHTGVVHYLNSVFTYSSQRALAASVAIFSLAALLSLSLIYSESSTTTATTQSQAGPTVATETYITETAIRASRILSDGSQVHLNALSALEFKASHDERHAILNQGQVLFDVAHDTQRPFIIDVGSSQVVVLGTLFDIDRTDKGMTLHVYEGVVTVSADKKILVHKGQSVSVINNKIEENKSHNDLMPTWRTGWLDVNQEPITQVIAKFQRYIDKPLKLDQSIPSDYKISGRFDLDNPIESLRLLSKISQLDVHIGVNDIDITPRTH